MASRRLRERQDVYEAKHYPERWQQERDEELEDKEQPEREDDPPPSNTFH
jgi:hypothetical protein